MRLRELTSTDTPAVHELLRACRLPTDGVPQDAALLLVAEVGTSIVGVAGLELHNGDGLLRSLAVAPGHRTRRIASRLVDEVEARAVALGARRLFLLTETAEKFFSRRGFSLLDRSLAPPAIAAARELTGVCPASAILMVRER